MPRVPPVSLDHAGAAGAAARHPSATRQILRVCFKAQWIVGGGCALVAILYPNVEVYGFLAGAFANAFIAKGLKRLIAQERPMQAAARLAAEAYGTQAAASHMVQTAASGVVASAVDAAVFAADELGVPHPSPTPILQALPVPQHDLGHGMPSSHATSLFFFASYLSLASHSVYLSRKHWDGRNEAPHPVVIFLRRVLPDWAEDSWDQGLGRHLFVGALYTLTALECYTRIRRQYHTWQQIVVGAALGTCVGYVHHRWVMPWIREASIDVPPLAERSPTFIGAFTVGMTLLAALTLERNTQRVAKRLLAGASAWLRGSPKVA